MTRNELKRELRAAGIYYPSSALKATLQSIYDRNLDADGNLIIKRRQDPNKPLIKAPLKIDNTHFDTTGLLVDEEQEQEQDKGLNDVLNADAEWDDLNTKIAEAKIPQPSDSTEAGEPLFESSKDKKKKGASDPNSFRVEGYILMLVVDTLFPFAFSTLNNMLDKRLKIKAHQLSLSEQDFAKLSPLADQAADYLAVNLSPVAGFFMVATFMYGSNLLNVRMQLDTK